MELVLTQHAVLVELDVEMVLHGHLAITQTLDRHYDIKIFHSPTDRTLEFVQFATCPCAA
jgi:hypothetical protein